VLRALFVDGKPLVTAKGEYRYTENGVTANGSAPVYVYENSVVSLPPDLGARRVPLCFVSGMDKGDYALTLRLDTGESYTYSKLGYDTAPIEAAVEKQIRALREKSLAAVKELDPTLTAAQASGIAKLMPEGAAAQFGRLTAIAPSFTAALEREIAETCQPGSGRAAEYYKAFKELCDPAQIYVGFIKNETTEESAAGGLPGALGGGLGGMLGGNPLGFGAPAKSQDFVGRGGATERASFSPQGGNEQSAVRDDEGGLTGGNNAEDSEIEAPPPNPYLFWLIAPSPDGQFATAEFSEADTATFVYRTNGDFEAFARQLNRALEAIAWGREVMRLTDEELRKPENADYYMAAKRTAALQFVRANFAGRVIHSNPEAWKKKLTEMWSGASVADEIPKPQNKPRFCGQCGSELSPGAKFCGKCGSRL
jgi:ribosomal protein L40E